MSQSEPLLAVTGCAVTVTVTTTTNPTSHIINFVLGEDQVQHWIESAIQNQPIGHKTSLPPHGTVTLDAITPPSDSLGASPTPASYLEQAEKLREQGNETFKQSDNFRGYRDATLLYNRALDLLRQAHGDTQLELKLRNNLALCSLRLSDWTEAIAHCDAALALDPSCAKAYYRRALAQVELDAFVRALVDLRKAHQLSPQDASITAELRRVEKESRKTLQKRRQQFAEVYNAMPQSSIFNDVIPT